MTDPAARPHEHAAPSRRAFTLVEMTVTLAIMSVLMTALGSVVVLASRALPHNEPAATAAAAAGLLVDQIASELRYATKVNVADATTLEFMVADRNNDGSAETIRYEWSGNAGDPLTRSYNGGGAVTVLEGVRSLAFAYDRLKVSTPQTTTVTNDSGEVLFARFDGWGAVATQAQSPVSTSSWSGQAFTINQVTIPSDATSVQLTRVGLKLKRPLSGGPNLSVAVHPRRSTGSVLPAVSPIGTPTVLASADLATYFATVDVRLNDAVLPDTSVRDLAIVVKGSGTVSGYTQYQTYASASADSNVFLWTSDSGSTWLPSASSQNRNDTVFYVYGTYTWTSTQQSDQDSYTLRTATLGLSVDGGRADTLVRAVNAPEAPGP